MKKIFATLLLVTFLIMQLSFNVIAVQGSNFIPKKNSTFESGTHSWSTLAGGSLSVVNNPDGDGKVLKYYNFHIRKPCQLL